MVQYAASSNGHAVLRDEWRVPSSDREAVICFRSQREAMEGSGFLDSQVLTFGSARGSNALANVERLHVIGRPMPPGDELTYLAQVLHHDDDKPVSGQIELRRPKYGGQRYEVPVVDFADPRVSALLHPRREDELLQVLHRGRLTTLAPQEQLIGLGSVPNGRRVRLVLHTNHPVPGLRVDQLIIDPPKAETNDVRQQDAMNRILAAVDRLRQRGEPLTVTAIAKEASANKATVSKVLGQRYIPLKNNLYKGVYRAPKTSDGREDIPPEKLDDLSAGEIDAALEPACWEDEL